MVEKRKGNVVALLAVETLDFSMGPITHFINSTQEYNGLCYFKDETLELAGREYQIIIGYKNELSEEEFQETMEKVKESILGG